MRVLFVVALSSVHLGCSNELPSCVEAVRADCAPLYAPTYDNVFERTLKPTCGQPGAACHASEGAQADLVFADKEATYATLLDAERGLIEAGNDQCSLLVVRIDAPEFEDVMPPGRQLLETERCAIRRWIAEGATR